MQASAGYDYGNRLYRNDILKVIAIVTMLIDHIGFLFFPKVVALRAIGRIAFPIFAYLLAKGFKRTRSLTHYALRLLAFACMSYMPYVYFNPQAAPNYLAFNVIFLLLLGLAVIAMWEYTLHMWRLARRSRFAAVRTVLAVLATLLFVALVIAPDCLTIACRNATIPYSARTYNLRLSYGSYGLLLILIFYWFESRARLAMLAFALLSLASAYLKSAYDISDMYQIVDVGLRFQAIGHALIQQAGAVWHRAMTHHGGLLALGGYFFQARAIVGVALVFWLKDLPARLKLHRYAAYLFYPIHIVILMQLYFFFVLR